MAAKKKGKDRIDLFRMLDAITHTKEDLTSHPLFERSYDPFMINRWLSMHQKTAFAAFFCDQMKLVGKAQHFRFLQSILDCGKVWIRYKKGGGQTDRKTLKTVQEYFQVGEKEASEIVDILNSKQMRMIRDSFGGRAGRAKKR